MSSRVVPDVVPNVIPHVLPVVIPDIILRSFSFCHQTSKSHSKVMWPPISTDRNARNFQIWHISWDFTQKISHLKNKAVYNSSANKNRGGKKSRFVTLYFLIFSSAAFVTNCRKLRCNFNLNDPINEATPKILQLPPLNRRYCVKHSFVVEHQHFNCQNEIINIIIRKSTSFPSTFLGRTPDTVRLKIAWKRHMWRWPSQTKKIYAKSDVRKWNYYPNIGRDHTGSLL